MPRVIWRHRARNDINRLHEFLKAKDPAAAERAGGVLLTAVRLLVSTPRVGRPLNDGTDRRDLLVPFGAAGYVVRYRVSDDQVIVIFRIWHAREGRVH